MAAIILPSQGTSAADRHKADNTDPLNSTTAWTEQITPGPLDVAVYDSTVTAANTAALGGNTAWGGLRIADPLGAIGISSGNTLTLGAFGIDMSNASQDLTVNSGLATASGVQAIWNVKAGRTLSLSSTASFTRGSGSTIKFINNGAINLAGTVTVNNLPATGQGLLIQATTGAPYAVVTDANGVVVDWAGLNSSKNIVRGDSFMTYNVPTASGSVLSSVSGPISGPMDLQQGGGINLTSNTTVNGGGIRFNTNRGGDWTVQIDASPGARTLTTGSMLVTPNVGPYNVVVSQSAGSTGGIREGGNITGGEFIIHQFNTQGSLILNAAINANTNSNNVTKDGPGQVIVGTTMGAGGTWRILEGSLQIGRNAAAGALPASASVVNGGNLIFSRSDAFTFSSNISGTGSVSFVNGTTILAGINSYTGSTTVTASALTLNGTHTNGAGYTIGDGATSAQLSGSGSTASSVTVKNAATLAPGSSGVGAITIGALTLESGATLSEEIDFSTDTADTTVTAGDVDLSGSPTLNLVFLGVAGTPSYPQGKTFIIINNQGSHAVAGNFANSSSIGALAYTIDTSYSGNAVNGTGDGNDVAVTFTAVPEPSIALLAPAFLSPILWRGRSKRRTHRHRQ